MTVDIMPHEQAPSTTSSPPLTPSTSTKEPTKKQRSDRSKSKRSAPPNINPQDQALADALHSLLLSLSHLICRLSPILSPLLHRLTLVLTYQDPFTSLLVLGVFVAIVGVGREIWIHGPFWGVLGYLGYAYARRLRSHNPPPDPKPITPDLAMTIQTLTSLTSTLHIHLSSLYALYTLLSFSRPSESASTALFRLIFLMYMLWIAALYTLGFKAVVILSATLGMGWGSEMGQLLFEAFRDWAPVWMERLGVQVDWFEEGTSSATLFMVDEDTRSRALGIATAALSTTRTTTTTTSKPKSKKKKSSSDKPKKQSIPKEPTRDIPAVIPVSTPENLIRPDTIVASPASDNNNDTIPKKEEIPPHPPRNTSLNNVVKYLSGPPPQISLPPPPSATPDAHFPSFPDESNVTVDMNPEWTYPDMHDDEFRRDLAGSLLRPSKPDQQQQQQQLMMGSNDSTLTIDKLADLISVARNSDLRCSSGESTISYGSLRREHERTEMQKEIQDGSRDPDEGMMTYSLQEPQDVIPMGVHQHALLLKSSLEEDPTGTLTRYYAEPEEVVVLPPTTTTEEEEIPQTYPVMTDLEEEDYDPAHHLSYQQHSQFQQDQDQDPFPFPINDPVPYQQQQPPLQQQHHRRHTFTSSPRSSLRGSNRKSLPLTLRFTTYENQRWFVGLGWVPHLLPGERPSYSDETGTTALPKESFKIPNFRGDELKNLSLSKGESPLLGVSEEITALGLDSHHQARVHWDWDSEWTVLPVLTGDPETLTDAQGWQYGDNFWSNYKNRKTLKRVTRRRKWVRSARLYDGGRKRSVTFGDRVVVFRPTDDKAFIELSSEDDDEEVVVRQPLMMEGEMEEEREWEEEQARLYQNLYAPRNPYGRPVSATS